LDRRSGSQNSDLGRRFGSQIWVAVCEPLLVARQCLQQAALPSRDRRQPVAAAGQPFWCILSADRAPVQAAGSLSVARPEPACRSGRDWSQPVAAGASLSQPQPAIRTSPSDKLFVILAPASQMHRRPSAQLLRSSVERRDATQQQVVTTPTTPPTTALQLGEKAPSHPPSFVLLWSVGCDQPSLA
jgi:hypothetical protein